MENLENNNLKHIDPRYVREKFLLLPIDSVDTLGEAVKPNSRNCEPLIAMEARSFSDETLVLASTKLISKGLVEHEFGGAGARNALQSGVEIAEKNVLITTSRSDEALAEALWFFIYAAVRAINYQATCKDWVSASIGDTCSS